jgi:hypothetical protein
MRGAAPFQTRREVFCGTRYRETRFSRPCERNCNSIAIDVDAVPGRKPLRITLANNFHFGTASTFCFFNPFAGTHGGADYEQFWHLCATRLQIGYWFCLYLQFGANVALGTWIGLSEERVRCAVQQLRIAGVRGLPISDHKLKHSVRCRGGDMASMARGCVGSRGSTAALSRASDSSCRFPTVSAPSRKRCRGAVCSARRRCHQRAVFRDTTRSAGATVSPRCRVGRPKRRRGRCDSRCARERRRAASGRPRSRRARTTPLALSGG